jgi:hypothetical protein
MGRLRTASHLPNQVLAIEPPSTATNGHCRYPAARGGIQITLFGITSVVHLGNQTADHIGSICRADTLARAAGPGIGRRGEVVTQLVRGAARSVS